MKSGRQKEIDKKDTLKVKSLAELQEEYEEKWKKILDCYREDFFKVHEDMEPSLHPHSFEIFVKECPGKTYTELRKITKFSKSHFQKFLNTCLKFGVIVHREGKYYLTDKYIYEPIRARYENTINEVPARGMIMRKQYTFYLPDNITVDDFEREDLIRLNKIGKEFFASIYTLLRKIRERKVSKIWDEKIICSNHINPFIKLYEWALLLVNEIFISSPKVFLSVATTKLDTKKGRLPREKAIDEWRKQGTSLQQEIFDNVLWKIWWRNNDCNPTDINQINLLARDWQKESLPYIKDALVEIDKASRENEYTIIINPMISGYGYKQEKVEREDIEFKKNFPLEFVIDYDDKITDASNYIRAKKEQQDLIEEEEIEKYGLKLRIVDDVMEEEEEPFDDGPDTLYEIGKNWFYNFDLDLQNKLLGFCEDLGYENKNEVFEVIGRFVSVHHLPCVPPPHKLLMKS